jgi:hypothetical protein
VSNQIYVGQAVNGQISLTGCGVSNGQLLSCKVSVSNCFITCFLLVKDGVCMHVTDQCVHYVINCVAMHVQF